MTLDKNQTDYITKLEQSLDDFLAWTGALAITGVPTPESWTTLLTITRKAQKLRSTPK